jgi:hypothetical protein
MAAYVNGTDTESTIAASAASQLAAYRHLRETDTFPTASDRSFRAA